jgi:dihydroneopterin aldolase
MNTDSLTLKRLRFFARHGVFPQEKTHGQVFEVTVRLEVPLAEAGRSDDLARAIDYRAIFEAVRAVMEGPSRQLAESLAEAIAAELLHAFKTVQAVEVEVTKPAPPVEFVFDGFSAKIRRTRAGA